MDAPPIIVVNKPKPPRSPKSVPLVLVVLATAVATSIATACVVWVLVAHRPAADALESNTTFTVEESNVTLSIKVPQEPAGDDAIRRAMPTDRADQLKYILGEGGYNRLNRDLQQSEAARIQDQERVQSGIESMIRKNADAVRNNPNR